MLDDFWNEARKDREPDQRQSLLSGSSQGLGTPSRLAQTVRDLALPLLFRMPAFRHTMVQRLSQLGVTYSGSPVVKGDGKRYFDDTLGSGNGICSKFLLMPGKAAAPSTKKAAEILAAEMTEVVQLRMSENEGMRLVRPDGYIAVDASTDDDRSISTMRTFLRAVTTQPINWR